MRSRKYYLTLLMFLGLFSVSVFAVDFKLTPSEKVQIEVESFLRHSGCKTKLSQNGTVHASKDNSTVSVKSISLNRDDSQPESVLCYISTTNTALYDSLYQDLNIFGTLYNINIDIMKFKGDSPL